VYENTKNSSEVLRYSAESMESVTKTITKPVFNSLGNVLTPLDRFACNQLDKVQRSFPSIAPLTSPLNSEFNQNFPPQEEKERKSRMATVVGSVGANLGVLSDETIRALRYCLQYLQYAISNMAHQIQILNNSLANAASKTKEILQTYYITN
jgi:hypothetical protein